LARNCRGSGQANSTVVFNPTAQGTQVQLLGKSLVAPRLSAGRHVITLTATNARGAADSTSVEVVIE
jgi:hypothetical protein